MENQELKKDYSQYWKNYYQENKEKYRENLRKYREKKKEKLNVNRAIKNKFSENEDYKNLENILQNFNEKYKTNLFLDF